jgi:hypothetical protein
MINEERILNPEMKLFHSIISVPVLTAILPISIGIFSGGWVMNSIDSSTSVSIKLLSSVILGFSTSLIYSFIVVIIILRLLEYDIGAEIIWGCHNIFTSIVFGSVCAGAYVIYRLFTQ